MLFDLSSYTPAGDNPKRTLDIVVTPGSVVNVNRPLGLQRNQNVLGSCHGLVALRSEKAKRDITIWNPLTGKFKKVSSNIPLPSNKLISYGFGYDPESDDYKLVGIASPGSSAIYSLKTNSWRKTGLVNWSFCCKCTRGKDYYWGQKWSCSFGELPKQAPVLANNTLHWGCFDEPGCKGIVAFDLVKEEFHCVPVPKFLEDQYHYSIKLGAFDGHLTLSGNGSDETFVWIMKEYRVRESWTQFLCFDWFYDVGSWLTDFSVVVPLAYSRNRDKLLLHSKGDFYDLHWYDLATKEVESCSYGLDDDSPGDVKTFEGSLVDPNESTDEIPVANEVVLKRKLSSSDVTKKRGKT